jgi:hypothetical protein
MITLTKIHNGDIVTDNSQEWSDGPESATVLGTSETGHFELLWGDGLHTFESLPTLSDAPNWTITCVH